MNAEKFRYVVKKEDEGLKIKSILKGNLGFSTRLLNKLKIQGGVFLEGEPAKMHLKPQEGQVITIGLPEERSDFIPEDIPISIVYEDEDLLIVNKQAGYVVHPTNGHPIHTLANGIMKYMIDSEQNFKIRFVNRLDMNTSGLLIVAKNSFCQKDFAVQMANDQVIKKYVALVTGHVTADSGTIDLPIGKADEERVERIVREDGAPSVTHYQVLNRYTKKGINRKEELIVKEFTLVELLLETGRTHQIRVHMAELGHPVVGDVLYGEDSPLLIERQALHATYLRFGHPVTKEILELEAPLPKDMMDLIEKIK